MVDFLEYIDGDTLKNLLELEEYQYYDEVLANVVIPITYALEALHDAGFVHLDVKPGNILITKKGEVKLGDYDLVTRIGTRVSTESGTPGFSSPEQKSKSRIVTEKSDVYALGKLLAYIITDHIEGPEITKIKEPELNSLIQECLRIKREDRPGLNEVRERLMEYLEKNGFQFEDEKIEA